MFNTILLLRKKAEQQRKNIRHERYEYYSESRSRCICNQSISQKIRDKDTMQKYLDADERLSTVSLKIEYYDTMLKFIEEILKQITNRTYQIKTQ